jgi:acyl carrier protein
MMSDISATLPPLRGIVHAAGVLDDGVLTEQTWERFAPVLAPKVEGSWNLHRLTRALPLDFFVMFSSLAAVAGAPGQANYAAANAFQDALATYRRSCGLPAVSIAWGAWADGMAAHDHLEERRRSIGIETMSAEQGLGLFAAALTGASARVVAGAFNWDRFAARYHPRPVPARFSHLISASPAAARPSADSASLQRWSTLSQSAGAVLLRDYLHTLAVRVLGFPSGRQIDPAQPLQELGLDSLMAVELRNALSAALEQNLPATLLFSYPALDDLNAFFSGLLWGNSPPPGQASVPNPGNLLDRLEQLSDEELDRLLAEKSGASQ